MLNRGVSHPPPQGSSHEPRDGVAEPALVLPMPPQSLEPDGDESAGDGCADDDHRFAIMISIMAIKTKMVCIKATRSVLMASSALVT